MYTKVSASFEKSGSSLSVYGSRFSRVGSGVSDFVEFRS